MRKHSWFAVSCLLLLPLLSFGEIYHLKMPSLALADSNRIIVATPTQFDANRKTTYPYIIMLHGWSGDETQWEADADLQFLADEHDILLVLPDGGYDGWWVDTEQTTGRNYETYLRLELPQWIEASYNASKKNSQRGIMGLSMGGFGALIQVLKHPGKYAAAASLSGVMDITRHPENWHLTKSLGLYSENQKGWKENNPLDLAQTRKWWHQPKILLICGSDDFTYAENQDLA